MSALHHAAQPVSPLFDDRPGAGPVGVPPQRIEQAAGVLMAVFGMDADAAHRLLVRTASHGDGDLAAVADRFLDGAGTITFGPGPVEAVVRLLAGLSAPPAGGGA